MHIGDKLLKQAKTFSEHLEEIIQKEKLTPTKLPQKIIDQKKLLNDLNYIIEKQVAQKKVDDDELEKAEPVEPNWGVDINEVRNGNKPDR